MMSPSKIKRSSDTALARLARRRHRLNVGLNRLDVLVMKTTGLALAGKTRQSHRLAKQMLDLEYELFCDCESTACLADAVELPGPEDP